MQAVVETAPVDPKRAAIGVVFIAAARHSRRRLETLVFSWRGCRCG